MASEVSIVKVLSGPEVVDILVAALRNALGKDDRFTAHAGYASLMGSLHIQMRAVPSSFIPDVDTTIIIAAGDEQAEGGEEIDIAVDVTPASPNEMRVEAGLPTPVLVTEADGKAHEEWRKTGPVPTKNRNPRNMKSQNNATEESNSQA